MAPAVTPWGTLKALCGPLSGRFLAPIEGGP